MCSADGFHVAVDWTRAIFRYDADLFVCFSYSLCWNFEIQIFMAFYLLHTRLISCTQYCTVKFDRMKK